MIKGNRIRPVCCRVMVAVVEATSAVDLGRAHSNLRYPLVSLIAKQSDSAELLIFI